MKGLIRSRTSTPVASSHLQRQTASLLRRGGQVCRCAGTFIPGLLFFFLFVSVSRPCALDYAQILLSDDAGMWMCLVYEGQGRVFGPDLCEYDRTLSWACPRCGMRDNTPLIDRCMSCGYPENNPEGFMFHPVVKGRITNAFSPGHEAVDYGIPEGSSVYAAEDGVVTGTSFDRWAGNVLRLRHEDGRETIYGHLDEVLVTEGSFVKMGDIIARSGCTGVSTGPHLHFEVRIDGMPVNPLDYVSGQ